MIQITVNIGTRKNGDSRFFFRTIEALDIFGILSTMKSKMTTTLLRLMLIYIVISAGLSTFSIVNLAYSLGDARVINASGSLRMQSYRLLFFANSGSQQALQKINEFEQTLYSDALANHGGFFTPKEIEDQYQMVVDKWQNMKQYILLEDSRSYAAKLIPFVDMIDHMVLLMEQHAKRKLIMLAVSLAVGLLIMLSMAFWAIRFAKRNLTTPLDDLVVASQRIRNREFELQLGQYHFAELTEVAGAFQQSANDMEELYRDLQSRVDQKTEALSKANQELVIANKVMTDLRGNQNIHIRLSAALTTITELEYVQYARIHLDDLMAQDIEAHNGWPKAVEPSLILPLSHDNSDVGELHLYGQCSLSKPLFEQLANMISRTLLIQKSEDERQQYALLDERATIARELHDSLGQVLAFLKIQTNLLRKGFKDDPIPQKAQTPLVAIEEGVSTAYRQLRELLTTFRLTINEPDLHSALVSMVEHLQKDCTAPITLQDEIPRHYLQPAQHIHILQVAREACINAIKHANPTKIIIGCRVVSPELVSITISDDGVGMPDINHKEGHFGLGIMQERAARLDGQINIETSAGHGTTIGLTFPASAVAKERT